MRAPHKILSAIIALALLLVQSVPAEGTPENRAAALFLLISPSVRVNGMGQAGVALADEPGGYYNPGAAALSAAGPTVQSQTYLGEMPWLRAIAPDLSYSYFAAQASASRIFDGFSRNGSTSLGAAFFGYRTRLDLGQRFSTDVKGNLTGKYTSADVANNIGVSLALKSVVDIGVGATAKWISSDTEVPGAGLERIRGEGSAKAYDFGLMVVVPAARALERLTGRELIWDRYLRPQLDIGFGAAWQNRGGATITYSGRPTSDPLPAVRRHGWSGSLAMDWSTDSLSLALGKVTFSKETYRPQIKGAEVTDIAEDDKSGIEISIMETFSLRRGNYDDFDGSIHLETSGRTVNSDGLSKLMAHLLRTAPASPGQNALRFLFEHLSFTWSRFEYDPEWPASGHSSVSLSLCLRNCG